MIALLVIICLMGLLADDLAVVSGLSAKAALKAVYARERAVEEWRERSV